MLDFNFGMAPGTVTQCLMKGLQLAMWSSTSIQASSSLWQHRATHFLVFA